MGDLLAYLTNFENFQGLVLWVLLGLGVLWAVTTYRRTKAKRWDFEHKMLDQSDFALEERLLRYAREGRNPRLFPILQHYPPRTRDAGLRVMVANSGPQEIQSWLDHREDCQSLEEDYCFEFLKKHFAAAQYKELLPHKDHPSVLRWFNLVGPEALSSDGLMELLEDESPGWISAHENKTQKRTK
jgi:hypothetical protein